MSSNRESDRIISAFERELLVLAAQDGWRLSRSVDGNADRSFEARIDGRSVVFDAHFSQSENGFWGLTADRAAEMRNRGDHLVLLQTESSGYFISNPALRRLMPRFSVHKLTGAIKINEGTVRAEQRFRDIDGLWELLKARSSPPAT